MRIYVYCNYIGPYDEFLTHKTVELDNILYKLREYLYFSKKDFYISGSGLLAVAVVVAVLPYKEIYGTHRKRSPV